MRRRIEGEAQLGFPVLGDRHEFVKEHPRWYESRLCDQRHGAGIEVFISKESGVDPDLLAICASEAAQAQENEALRATWAQIDRDNRVWRIPTSNQKSKKAWSVPLNVLVGAVIYTASLSLQGHRDNQTPHKALGLHSLSCAPSADLPQASTQQLS